MNTRTALDEDTIAYACEYLNLEHVPTSTTELKKAKNKQLKKYLHYEDDFQALNNHSNNTLLIKQINRAYDTLLPVVMENQAQRKLFRKKEEKKINKKTKETAQIMEYVIKKDKLAQKLESIALKIILITIFVIIIKHKFNITLQATVTAWTITYSLISVLTIIVAIVKSRILGIITMIGSILSIYLLLEKNSIFINTNTSIIYKAIIIIVWLVLSLRDLHILSKYNEIKKLLSD